MSPKYQIQKRYLQRLQERLISQRGGRCQEEDCGSTEELEFAHIKPTGLQGNGRGKANRLLDIQKHPDAYKLLCRPCHAARDGFSYKDHRVSEEKEETPF